MVADIAFCYLRTRATHLDGLKQKIHPKVSLFPGMVSEWAYSEWCSCRSDVLTFFSLISTKIFLIK